MSTLAIDIGGTKFSMAVFDGERMIERESHATDRSILDRIAAIIRRPGKRAFPSIDAESASAAP